MTGTPTNAKQALQSRKAAAPSQSNRTTSMKAMLVRMADEIKNALPENIKSERFQRVALTAFSNNTKLQQCDPVSFIAAMMQSAQLGLEPNTPLGQAYLIPYGNQVQFQIGYKGLIDLAMRSGQYQSIYAQTVYANDEFDLNYGLNQDIVHKPLLTGDRGKAIGYYAIYKLKNGGYGLTYMSKDDITKFAKNKSKTFHSGPWQTDFDAMAKKTVIKQLLKYAPMSIEVQRATVIDERVAKGEPEAGESVNLIETEWERVEETDPETGEIIPADDSYLGADFVPLTGDEI